MKPTSDPRLQDFLLRLQDFIKQTSIDLDGHVVRLFWHSV
jgi:hypothetical protein